MIRSSPKLSEEQFSGLTELGVWPEDSIGETTCLWDSGPSNRMAKRDGGKVEFGPNEEAAIEAEAQWVEEIDYMYREQTIKRYVGDNEGRMEKNHNWNEAHSIGLQSEVLVCSHSSHGLRTSC